MRRATLVIALLLAACSTGERSVEVTDATIDGTDYMEVINPV